MTTDQSEPEDTCRSVEIGAETVVVRGAAELTDEGREALTALVGAARRKMAAEPPPVRQQLQAVAFNAVLPALEKHGEWLRLTVRRTIANAVLEALEGQLDISEAEAWCKVCRRVWDGPRHRCESDAEQTVSRVVDLYKRWVQEGPPKLGTLISREWDRRLAELHAAIKPPVHASQEPS